MPSAVVVGVALGYRAHASLARDPVNICRDIRRGILCSNAYRLGEAITINNDIVCIVRLVGINTIAITLKCRDSIAGYFISTQFVSGYRIHRELNGFATFGTYLQCFIGERTI